METGNNISESSLVRQDLHLLPDNPRDLTGDGQTSLVSLTRNGIHVLRRDAEFKVNEFASFKFPYTLDDTRWLNHIDSVIESEGFKSLTENATPTFSIEDRKVLLLPKALFSDKTAKANFEFLFGDSTNLELLTTELDSINSIAVYGVPSKMIKLTETKIQSGFIHWLEMNQNANKLSVKCHVSENQVAFVITDGDNLRFSNWFEYQKTEDVLYFLMATLETNKILHSEVELTLSGDVVKDDEIHSSIGKFIPKINFATRPKNLNYAYSFKELPEHKFPFLFASACA